MATTVNTAALNSSNIANIGGGSAFNPSYQFQNQYSNWWNAPSTNTIGTVYSNIANPQNAVVNPGAPQQTGAQNFINGIGLANSAFKFATGGSNGITTALNDFGSNTLGFASQSGAPLSQGFGGLQGPTNAFDKAGSFSTSSFTNSLGGQAFGSNGFLGSLGSSSLDSIGSGLVNAGAGYLGSLAGSALFGKSAGSQVGGTVGGIAGSYFGPVGSFAGSFIGSAIGSLFGGGTPHPAGTYGNIGIGADGTLSGGGMVQGKHVTADNFKPYVNDFQTYLSGQTKKYGITNLNPNLNINFGYDVKGSPSFVGGSSELNSAITFGDSRHVTSGSQFVFNPQDDKSRLGAYDKAWNYILNSSNIDPATLKEVQAANNTSPITGTPTTIGPVNDSNKWSDFLAAYRASNSI
jgi:hypothetical protein